MRYEVESLLGEKVRAELGQSVVKRECPFHDLPRVFRKLGTLKWETSSNIARTGLSKLNTTPSYCSLLLSLHSLRFHMEPH